MYYIHVIGLNLYMYKHENQTNVPVIVSSIFSIFKSFKKWVKLQGQGHRVKNVGTHGKTWPLEIFMRNE